eukprot:1151551-Pelagomonas_calceolata.AAC.2
MDVVHKEHPSISHHQEEQQQAMHVALCMAGRPEDSFGMQHSRFTPRIELSKRKVMNCGDWAAGPKQ